MLPKKFVIIDDVPMLVHAAHQYLMQIPHLQLAASGSVGEEILQLAQQHQPDILIFDYRLPNQSPHAPCIALLPTILQLQQLQPQTKLIIWTRCKDAVPIYHAVRAQVDAIVCKGDPPQLLLTAIQTILNDQTYLSPGATRAYTTSLQLEVAGVSLRQQEVITNLIHHPHYVNEQLAQMMGISKSTFKTHLGLAMRTMNAHNSRTALALKGLQLGIASLDDAILG